jgi:hypothetical protein
MHLRKVCGIATGRAHSRWASCRPDHYTEVQEALRWSGRHWGAGSPALQLGIIYRLQVPKRCGTLAALVPKRRRSMQPARRAFNLSRIGGCAIACGSRCLGRKRHGRGGHCGRGGQCGGGGSSGHREREHHIVDGQIFRETARRCMDEHRCTREVHTSNESAWSRPTLCSNEKKTI